MSRMSPPPGHTTISRRCSIGGLLPLSLPTEAPSTLSDRKSGVDGVPNNQPLSFLAPFAGRSWVIVLAGVLTCGAFSPSFSEADIVRTRNGFRPHVQGAIAPRTIFLQVRVRAADRHPIYKVETGAAGSCPCVRSRLDDKLSSVNPARLRGWAAISRL